MLHRLLRGVVLIVAVCVGFSTISTRATATPNATPAADCDPAKGTCVFKPLPEPKPASYNQTAITKIDLEKYPLVPEITEHVKQIYQEGLKKGNNIRIFSKIGDCMTATDDFMKPFSTTSYVLGDYDSLAKVIKVFAKVPARGSDSTVDSFDNPGLAAVSGFNSAGVLDSIWSDPKFCKADESPLSCEYRLSKPGIALIMFGTNDLKSIQSDQFNFYLRRVVVQTANAGIIPILSTFPVQPGFEKESDLFNQITVQIALDYDIPLMNLYAALKPLPHQGVDPVNTTHMTKPDNGNAGDLSKDGLQFGYNVHNLLTLQSLEAVLKAVAPDLLDSATR
ncbi:MAG: SGNH/GDSL hydrolase family protein [Chloroflexota bacterium]